MTSTDHLTRKPPGQATKVLIVGAGIGGLATAVSCRQAGCDVAVLEQAPELSAVGAGMSLWSNALDALDALGLGDQVRSTGVMAVTRGSFRTPTGSWLRRARRDDITALVLLRSDLHRILLEACADVDVRLGAHVESVVPTEDGATVGYQMLGERRQDSADVLIGADGIDSVVRRSAWPRTTTRFQRRTAWRGVTQETFGEQIGPGCLTLGHKQQFGALPLPQGCYWFLTADVDDPDVRHDDELAEVRRRVGRWHSPIPDILDATPPQSVLHHDIVDLDPLSSFAEGRLAVIGDAAHAMTPDLGQGGCQALEDAVALGHCLATTDDPAAALLRYDATRRPRAQRIAEASRTSGTLRRDQGALASAATQLALRVMPAPLWRKSVAQWLGSD